MKTSTDPPASLLTGRNIFRPRQGTQSSNESIRNTPTQTPAGGRRSGVLGLRVPSPSATSGSPRMLGRSLLLINGFGVSGAVRSSRASRREQVLALLEEALQVLNSGQEQNLVSPRRNVSDNTTLACSMPSEQGGDHHEDQDEEDIPNEERDQ